jgi:hypothetical protein
VQIIRIESVSAQMLALDTCGYEASMRIPIPLYERVFYDRVFHDRVYRLQKSVFPFKRKKKNTSIRIHAPHQIDPTLPTSFILQRNYIYRQFYLDPVVANFILILS